MINKELLNAAFSEIADEYVIRAMDPPIRKKKPWIQIAASAAAVLFIVIPGIASLLNSVLPDLPHSGSTPYESDIFPLGSNSDESAESSRPREELDHLILELCDNEYYKIISYKPGLPETLIAPDEHNGIPIRTVGEGAFSGAPVKEILLPDSITEIGDRAFSDCPQLTKINIPINVTMLGGELLYGSQSVDTVTYSARAAYTDTEEERVLGYVKRLVITDSVLLIPDLLCRGATTLTKVQMGQNVKCIGKMAFQNTDRLTSVELPAGLLHIDDYAFNGSALSSLTLPDTLEKIGSYAFKYIRLNCQELVIPQSVTSLGREAFANAGWVEKLILRASIAHNAAGIFPFASLNAKKISVEADIHADYNIFSGIKGTEEITLDMPSGTVTRNILFSLTDIRRVTLGDNVHTLGESAFEGLKNLSAIEGLKGIKRIEDRAFYECTSLKIIDVSGVSEFGSYIFARSGIESIVLPEAMTSIPEGFFCAAPYLKSVTLPKGLTEIPSSAFEYSAITHIVIPDTVTTIGSSAFRYCRGLQSISLPSSLKSIGDKAFERCDSLSRIDLPEGLESIGNDAFLFCDMIEVVIIPSTVTEMGSAFRSCASLTIADLGDCGITALADSAFSSCEALVTVILPKGLVSIGKEAFYKCRSIVSVSIPDGCTLIDERAFFYCSSLMYVDFGESLQIIESTAFASCETLSEISLPDTMVRIGASAFSGSGIRKAYLGASIVYIGAFTFNRCPITSFYIPKTFMGAYEGSYNLDEIFEGRDVYTEYEELPKRWQTESETTVYTGYTYEEYLKEISQ